MLYPCRECGKDISEEARRCPYCGVKRPMIRTELHPWRIHKPGRAKSKLGQAAEVIGGLVGIAVVIGLFTDFYGLTKPDYANLDFGSSRASTPKSTHLTAPSFLLDEVERFIIEPCLRAYLELDPAYRTATNKPEREIAFRYDPRVRDMLDDTIARSVRAVRGNTELEGRQIVYKRLLAACARGAQR